MMKGYRYLLLDLDGTITDPGEGITKSVQYALEHIGIWVEDTTELFRFIGPPLADSFREFYGVPEKEIPFVLQKYRERFVEKGIYENKLYEGMKEFLSMANRNGLELYLATSKPTVFAADILEYFGLRDEILFVGGSDLDGSRSTKGEVIRYVLEMNPRIIPEKAVMIGDRKFDVSGAKETGIDSIGVLYGYGTREELEEAGADYVVRDLTELSRLLGI